MRQAVTCGTNEAVAHLDKGFRGVQGTVDWYCIGAVDRIGSRFDIEGYRQVVPCGGVDDASVATTVTGTTTAIAVDAGVVAHIELVGGQVANKWLKVYMHCHRIVVRVGQVVGSNAILTAPGGGRHTAVKCMRVESLHRVGGVARLQVGEGAAVCDDVLEGFDVGIVCGRIVDIAEDTIGNREPDL